MMMNADFDADYSALSGERQKYSTDEVLSVLSDVHRVTLPMLSIRRFTYRRDSAVTEEPPALMTEHELIFITEGTVTYIIGGDTWTVSAGSCIYIAPGELRCRPENQEKASFISVSFWNDTAAGLGKSNAFSFPHQIPYALDPDVSTSVQYLLRVCENVTPDQRIKCLAVLQLLLVQLEDFLLRYSENPYVREMKAYLLLHYREGVQLADLADHVGLHPVYCSKIFKLSEGVTVGSFINRLRVTRAAAQLESVEETSEVAHDLGLSDFYFSRWFRQMTGLSPTEYRSALRAGYKKDRH